MRIVGLPLTLLLLASAGAALASEKGLVIRGGDLMAQPFIDAAKTGPVEPNQPIVILERRGPWVNVEANGRSGWLRTLNVRLEPPAHAAPVAAGTPANRPSVGSLSNPASLLRTGSSGRTVTTGVKGLDEEDIRNASVDPQQLEELSTLSVAESEARENAASSKLAENRVDYLKKGKAK